MLATEPTPVLILIHQTNSYMRVVRKLQIVVVVGHETAAAADLTFNRLLSVTVQPALVLVVKIPFSAVEVMNK